MKDYGTLFETFMPISANKAIKPKHLAQFIRDNKDLVVEEKFDGSLYVARFYDDGTVTFKSRRESVSGGACDRTAQLVHLAHAPKALGGTMLLVEIVDPGGNHGRVNSVLLSKPELALKKQEKDGYLRAMIFDCLFFRGTCLLGAPFKERRCRVIDVGSLWPNPYTQLSRQQPAGYALPWFQEIVKRGGEGIMLKDKKKPYGEGLYKCKKISDVSAAITGFTEGKGKYKGQIGAIVFSLWDEKAQKWVEVGQCSGMDDEQRSQLTKCQAGFKNTVIDVECQPPDHPETWNPYEERFRHPRFVGWRTDLSSRQATVEKCRQDFLRIV